MDGTLMPSCLRASMLRAEASTEDFRSFCEAVADAHYGVITVCPAPMGLCRQLLSDTPIQICTAVGYPWGQNTLDCKLFEAMEAMDNGADEINYMINLGRVRDGNWKYIEQEMRRMNDLCRRRSIGCIVTLDASVLTREELASTAEIVRHVGPDAVQTVLSGSSIPTRTENIMLIRRIVGDRIRIIAAGIRSQADCHRMFNAGADQVDIEMETTTIL